MGASIRPQQCNGTFPFESKLKLRLFRRNRFFNTILRMTEYNIVVEEFNLIYNPFHVTSSNKYSNGMFEFFELICLRVQIYYNRIENICLLCFFISFIVYLLIIVNVLLDSLVPFAQSFHLSSSILSLVLYLAYYFLSIRRITNVILEELKLNAPEGVFPVIS